MLRKQIILLLLLMPVVGMAFDDNDHEDAMKLNEQGKIVALELILDKLHDRTSGRLLQVELHQDEDIPVYEVEVVDDTGLVWAYRFDASNGNFIEVTKDSN